MKEYYLTPSFKANYYGILKVTHKILVYSWIRNNQYLYIGFTIQGIMRFNNHPVIQQGLINEDIDTFNFWYCNNEQQVRNLEKSLIRFNKPLYNKVKYDRQERLKAMRRSERIRIDNLRAQENLNSLNNDTHNTKIIEGPVFLRKKPIEPKNPLPLHSPENPWGL